jgi:hypothetical protein
MPREADGGSGFTRLRRDAGGSPWVRTMRRAVTGVTGLAIGGVSPRTSPDVRIGLHRRLDGRLRHFLNHD